MVFIFFLMIRGICLSITLLVFTWLSTQPAVAQRSKRKNQQQTEVQQQKSSGQAEYNFSEGMKYYVLENYPKAVDYFRKSLDMDPENSGANYVTADALFKSGNVTQAIPYAEKALKSDESNKYYYQLLARLYEADKRFPQAIKVYQELTKRLPNDPEGYVELANVYLSQEKYEDALKVYDRVEKITGLSEEIIRQKQQLYLKLDKTDEAIAEGKKLVEAYPDDIRYAILLAEIYITSNRAKEALPLLERIVTEEPEQGQARLILSDIYRNNGQPEKADAELIQAFSNPDLEADTKVQVLSSYMRVLKDKASQEKALKLADLIVKIHPTEARAYAVYGDLLAMSDEKARARDSYATASRLDNSIYEVWNQIIRLDLELQQTDSLMIHSEQALELFPNQAVFWFYNGMANLIKKDYEKSVESLEEGKKLALSNKELMNDVNAMLGDAYNGIGDYKKSDEAYEAVLVQEPDNASVLNNYSYYLSLRKEKLAQAQKMAGQLVEKNPTNPTYLDTYGWVLFVSKEYAQARKYLERAAKDSTNGTILEHYGDVLYKLGETDKALELWMKAKQAGQGSELIDQKIAQKKFYE